jgi:hypothetical protein
LTSTLTSHTTLILSNSASSGSGTVTGCTSKRSSSSSASVHWPDQLDHTQKTVKLVDKEHCIRKLEFEDQLQRLDSRHFVDLFRRTPGIQMLSSHTNGMHPLVQQNQS